MSYTQPPTKAAGDTLSAADWNTYVGANGSALFSPPACRVLNTVGTTTSASFAVPFTSEAFDTHDMHDNSTNNTRITIPSGWGGVWAFNALASHTFGTVVGFILLGGTAPVGAAGPATFYTGVAAIVEASPGDWFQFTVGDAGSGTATFGTASFSAVWLRGPV
ncbi:hypothetical protein [Microcystis phage Mae-JY09]